MKIKIHRNVGRVDLERLKISGDFNEGEVKDIPADVAKKLVEANLATSLEKASKTDA